MTTHECEYVLFLSKDKIMSAIWKFSQWKVVKMFPFPKKVHYWEVSVNGGFTVLKLKLILS